MAHGPISEEDIRKLMEIMGAENSGMAVGGGGELGLDTLQGMREVSPTGALGQVPENIAQPQTIDELSGPVPSDVSNMVPAGSLQGAESVGAGETHTMPDGTVHPYSTHEEMMVALLKNQGIEGAELVGADPRGTRLGRGRY